MAIRYVNLRGEMATRYVNLRGEMAIRYVNPASGGFGNEKLNKVVSIKNVTMWCGGGGVIIYDIYVHTQSNLGGGGIKDSSEVENILLMKVHSAFPSYKTQSFVFTWGTRIVPQPPSIPPQSSWILTARGSSIVRIRYLQHRQPTPGCSTPGRSVIDADCRVLWSLQIIDTYCRLLMVIADYCRYDVWLWRLKVDFWQWVTDYWCSSRPEIISDYTVPLWNRNLLLISFQIISWR